VGGSHLPTYINRQARHMFIFPFTYFESTLNLFHFWWLSLVVAIAWRKLQTHLLHLEGSFTCLRRGLPLLLFFMLGSFGSWTLAVRVESHQILSSRLKEVAGVYSAPQSGLFQLSSVGGWQLSNLLTAKLSNFGAHFRSSPSGERNLVAF